MDLYDILSNILIKTGEINDFFAKAKNDGLGHAVLYLLSKFKQYLYIPKYSNRKTEDLSKHYRELGNQHFVKQQYENALHYYNIAIMCAPLKSRALKLAYGNRSALFFKINNFKACLTDIETCLSLNYPMDLLPKLLKRKELCAELIKNNVNENRRETCLSYFKIRNGNEKIACASASVSIQDNVVITAKEINVGEVISVETAYTATFVKYDYMTCCYYCQRFTENLLPCDSCAYVMFCSQDCQQKCWKEHHSIVCQINDTVPLMPTIVLLGLKTVLKARSCCSSWDELIKTVNEAVTITSDNFDSASYAQLCKITEMPEAEQYEKYNKILLYAYFVAIIVFRLSDVPSFMPSNPNDKKRIMLFFANQLMFHIIRGVPSSISRSIILRPETVTERGGRNGFFPFTSKLRHSCNPNVLNFGLDNKIVLIASRKISKGTELVMSYAFHYLDSDKFTRRNELYQRHAFVCYCEACRNDWILSNEYALFHNPTEVQENILIEIAKFGQNIVCKVAIDRFKTCCAGVELFQDMPLSTYYRMCFEAMKSCIAIIQVDSEQHFEGSGTIFEDYYHRV